MVQKKQGDATTGGLGIISEIQKKPRKVNWEVMGRKLLGVVCGMVLGGILVAGLWPFHAPKNDVTWLAGGDGVHFGRHGTILSSAKFQAAEVAADAPCTLEIWIEPDHTGASGTLLTFYAPGSPRQFSLHQSISDLAIQSDIRDGRNQPRTIRLYLDYLFRRGKPLFVTVTSNGGQTSVYIDGVLAQATSKFPLSRQDFDGELIIANSPVDGNSWSGLLRGLAFYNQDLPPAEVYRHFATWTTKGRPEVSGNDRAVALYLFNERTGSVIHNQVPSGIDLYIPYRYQVVDQALLTPFWKEFQPNGSYWADVLVNIAGFVPLGFLFCAYFSLAGRIKRPAQVTILLGFAVSLTIESLQAFLPTRDSGTTDLITNTLGTCLGVGLYRMKFWRGLFARTWAHFVGIAEGPSHTQ
jgi:VanZ family protein